MSTLASRTLPAQLASATEARHVVRDALERWGLDHLGDDASLVATELVTNAVLHARTDVTVTVSRAGAGVRVEVADEAPRLLPVLTVQPAIAATEDDDDLSVLEAVFSEAMTGRGLRLIDALADAWGVDAGRSRKSVWVDIGTGDAGDRAVPATVPGRTPPVSVPTRGVRLLAVPVRLAVASDTNIDDLVREFQMVSGGNGADLPELGSIGEVLEQVTAMRSNARETVWAAADRGERLTDIDLQLPLDAPEALWRLIGLVEQLGELSRRGTLLNVAPSDELVTFRRWSVDEIERQLRGAPPSPCPFPVLAADDPAMKAAIRAANRRVVQSRTRQAGAARARLDRLGDALVSLAGAQTEDEIGSAALDAAVAELRASTASLCVVESGGISVRLAGAVGYPADVLAHWRNFALSDDLPASEAIRTGEPVVWRTREERDARYFVFRSTPVVDDPAMAVVPLTGGAGVRNGALVLGFVAERDFDHGEWTFLTALAAATAQAVDRLRLAERVTVADERAVMTARVSDLLAAAVDIDGALTELVRLAVPGLGDWCAMHLLEDGQPRLVDVAHADPGRHELARRFVTRWPARLDPGYPVGRCLLTGEATRFQVVQERALEDTAVNPEHLAAMRELDMGSGMIVPVATGGRVLGALTVVNRRGRVVTDHDWRLANDIGGRVGAFLATAGGTGARRAEPGGGDGSRPLVDVDDLLACVRAVRRALGAPRLDGWDRPAGDLAWSCARTLDHTVRALVRYATHLARCAGEPLPELRRGDPDAAPPVLLDQLETAAALLGSAARAAGPGAAGWHATGAADAEGFLAMGCDELLVHGEDIAATLGARLVPPPGVAAAILRRLFPWAPRDTDPWDTLRWANGRTELPGHGRLGDDWSWHAAPLAEWDGTVPRRKRG